MASTGYQILRSTDFGAPTLNGTAGSLLGVLRALLDTGGSDAYWQEVFTGTNKAVFRALSGERYYLRVDDSTAQYASVRAFDTMSDVDTGTNQFPSGAQMTNNVWHKSNTANSTARTYLGVASDRFFLLLVSGGWTGSGQDLYCFGETKKTNPSDTGATVLRASPNTTLANGFQLGALSSSPFDQVSSYSAATANSAGLMAVAKSSDGSAFAAAGVFFRPAGSPSVRFGTYADIALIPTYYGTAVSGSAGKMRGSLPFIYGTMNDQGDTGLANGDTFTDANGATYQLCQPNGTTAAGSNYPFVAIMTSNSETGVP